MGKPRTIDHDAVLKDYLVGMSVKEIAAKYGCAGNLGSKLARAAGVTRSPAVVKRVMSQRSKLGRITRANSAQGKQQQKRNKQIAASVKRIGIKETAGKFGLTNHSVRSIARQFGWQPAPQLDRDAILKEYLAGASLKALAAKHGCNLAYPSTLASLAGVKRDTALIAKGRGRKRKA